MNTINSVIEQEQGKHGTSFERALIWAANKVFGKGSCKDLTGTDVDKFEGTDAELFGVRLDMTTNFEGKDHMEEIGVYALSYWGVEVKFGVRTGNARRAFNVPVLVVGFNETEVASVNFDAVVESIMDHAEEILNVGQDLFFDYCDARNLALQ